MQRIVLTSLTVAMSPKRGRPSHERQTTQDESSARQCRADNRKQMSVSSRSTSRHTKIFNLLCSCSEHRRNLVLQNNKHGKINKPVKFCSNGALVTFISQH
ncbi:hypothetical protein GDO78_013165 [Eleutherodactylus coqui]|uniref:Uncharacterized protein n=1 Tax=Eleutherodactylus coqui TaxID=57060 RepID=A0A8J6F0E2_ELECQ|nr:hypothetical protein GDO78_013165 [Eleutherodactylus coqui]